MKSVEFKPGDKVICIDAMTKDRRRKMATITNGKEYEILSFNPQESYGGWVELKSNDRGMHDEGYYADRFELKTKNYEIC